MMQEDEDEDADDHAKGQEKEEENDTSVKPLYPAWQHENVVMDLLDYYTEQGDVQMCVTLYLVLQKYLNVPQTRLEDWFTSYLGK